MSVITAVIAPAAANELTSSSLRPLTVASEGGNGQFIANAGNAGHCQCSAFRRCAVGVGVSVVAGAGPALIGGNVMSDTPKGAVVGYDHDKAVTGDLTKPGAGGGSPLPAGLRVDGNAAS